MTNPNGSNTHTTAWVAIIIALISAVGAVLAAVFGPQVVVNVNEQGQATAIAALQPTIDSLQSIPNSTTQIIEVTKEVVVTREIEITKEIEVTRLVEVTRTIEAVTVTPFQNPITQAGTILKDGETWYGEKFSIKIMRFNYKTLDNIYMLFQNTTGREILFPGFDRVEFELLSDVGGSCKLTLTTSQRELKVDEKLEYSLVFSPSPNITPTCYGMPPPNATNLTLYMKDIGGFIKEAKWQTSIPRP